MALSSPQLGGSGIGKLPTAAPENDPTEEK